LRVLIADQNLFVRTGIRSLISGPLSVTEAGEAACSADALALLRVQPWHLCVLDVALPERGGLEVAQFVRKARLRTALLFLSSRSDRQYASAALREGARGFIMRDGSREELCTAARAVLNGDFYVSPQLSDQLIGNAATDRPSHERLSMRELQVFRKLALGTALTVISKDLSISPKSVSTYRSRILEKTHCRNNAEITRYAIREGLI
jgi:two-component system invasion response regulator UvrY